jgi:hypothetical protein
LRCVVRHCRDTEIEKEQRDSRYFSAVIKGYQVLAENQPLVAVNYDPQGVRHKLTPDVVNFLADVEMATERALKTPELLKLWKAVVAEEQVATSAIRRIARLCGRLYRSRGLAPIDYWRRTHIGSAA